MSDIDGYRLDRDYQYEFNGLVYGSGTDIIVEQVEGLLSMPDANSNDHNLQGEHGVEPGLLLMEGRSVEFDLTVVGGAGIDIEEKLAVMRKTFQAPRKRNSRELKPFVFMRSGSERKFLMARCTRREFKSDYKTARGVARGAVRLDCPDPIIYSLQEYRKELTLAGGVTNGQMTIMNLGDYEDGYEPIIELTGPVTNPVITNVHDDDRAIRLDLVLAAGGTLVIDVRAERLWVNGVETFDPVRNDNQWWSLLPDENTITYNRSGGNAAASSKLTIRHRHTWQ